jgi:hypothetical protein
MIVVREPLFSYMSRRDETTSYVVNEKRKRRSGIWSLFFSRQKHQQDLHTPVDTESMSDEIASNPGDCSYLTNDSLRSDNESKKGSPETHQATAPIRWKPHLNRCLNCVFRQERGSNETVLQKKDTQKEEEEGTIRHEQDLVTPLGLSRVSAFSPPVKSECAATTAYPTQERNTYSTQLDKIALYPFTVRVKEVPSGSTFAVEDRRRFLAVECDDDFAQLQYIATDESEERPVLGVSFPHPAFAEEKSCLGVQSSHPYWIKKERGDIWKYVDSDQLDGEDVTNPPSPIVVETKTQAEEEWSNFRPEDNILSEIWNTNFVRPIYSLAKEVAGCGQLKDSSSDVSEVPFDEFAVDKERDGLDPEMMMLSRFSDTGSLCQYYLDEEESLDGDGCEYSNSVSAVYSNMRDGFYGNHSRVSFSK